LEGVESLESGLSPWALTWEQEHRLEVAALRKTAAEHPDEWWRSVLLGLAAEKVTSLEEHMQWGERLVMTWTEATRAQAARSRPPAQAQRHGRRDPWGESAFTGRRLEGEERLTRQRR
jgi:hypothetical protein